MSNLCCEKSTVTPSNRPDFPNFFCCGKNAGGRIEGGGGVAAQGVGGGIAGVRPSANNVYTYNSHYHLPAGYTSNGLKYKDKYGSPTVVTQKVIEVPHVLHREKIVHVPKVELVERVIPIHKNRFVEKIVEVPQYQYKEVPVEKIVAVPEVRTEVIYKEVPVPQNVVIPVPQARQILMPQCIQKNVACPVKLNTVQNFKMPKLKPKYVDVSVPIYVPRYIEVPVPVPFTEGEDNKNMNETDSKMLNVFNNNVFKNCLNNKNSTPTIQTVDEEDISGLTERSVSQDINNEISSKKVTENNFSPLVMSCPAEVKA